MDIACMEWIEIAFGTRFEVFGMKTQVYFIVVIFQNIVLIPIRESSIKEQNIYPKLNYQIQQMEPSHKATEYHPQHYFHYPFTLVSHPKKTFLSKPIQQPTAFEVYCPISCKKIKIGAAKPKQKEGVQFNTTSSRLVSTILNKQIKYLINGNPPNKRDKKLVEGSDWSFWVEVSQKGNIAIFNPYCYIPNDPLSLYTFSHLTKFEHPPQLPQFGRLTHKSDYQEIKVENNTFYFRQSENGSYISTNTHFDDAVNGELTFVAPNDENRFLKLRTEEALKLIPALRHYWLHQLHIHMIAQKETESSIPLHNLDEVYQGFGFALNLEEQLRAKLSNKEGVTQLDSKLGYHPRLYSAINRLASFINYGVTKYDRRKLAELGFYNRSDMLQDLRFFQKPQITIPSAQNPWYQNEADLRSKLFPFSRLQRGLPNSNVSLNTFINALLHQQISPLKIKYYEVFGPYVLFVDEENTVSVWSCRLFPIKLFSFNRNIEFQPLQTQIAIGEKELEAINTHIEKEDNSLASLFEQVAPVAKEEKPPAQIVPDPAMIQQMQQMGYGIGLIKKALITVKNESIPAALDIMDQLMAEEKKKIKEKKTAWDCPACTFVNKAQNDTCEICGEIYVYVDQGQKERQRLQKEAQLQKERKEKEQKQRVLKQAEQAKKKAELQQAERLKKIQQKEEMLKKAQLLDTKAIYRQKSPIDPFFIFQLFWNNDLEKCYLKVMRAGVSRQFFARFYRVEDKILSSNIKRFPMALTLQSFEKIAEQSVDQRQWGVRLIEPSHDNEWGIISIQEIELTSRFNELEINGDYVTVKSATQEIYFELKIKDSIQKADFQCVSTQKPNIIVPQKIQVAKQQEKSSIQTIQIKVGEELKLDNQVSQIQVEVLQHLPGGVWIPSPPQSVPSEISTAKQGEVVINQLIPLFIQEFEGSVFSGKHYSTTVLQKSANLYISNYPNINFTFRHLNGKSVFAQSVVIISSTKRLQRIFSVYEGLIFTADQPSWFHIAKEKFQKFTKSDYQQWLTTKRARNQHRQFWEPVAFFQFQGETQIEIDYKRTAKYVFLLPTNVKGGEKKKDQVYAVKVDFFGVKGRVQDDKNLVKGSFKNEGCSRCSVQLQRSGEPVDQHSIVSKVWGNVNSFHFHTPNLNYLQMAPLSTTTVFLYKLRSKRQPISLKVSSAYAKKVIVRLSREVSEDIVDSSAINSFSELARVQNDFSSAQLKKIAEKLEPRDLLQLLLKAERQVSSYQALIKKLQESIDFKEKLFLIILELVPKLVDNEIEVTQSGFKSFLTLYEKQIGNQPNLAFTANTDALKKISHYVSQNRNKNYNILRSKYNISELILQPYLFSKDYYRMVYPNYVEEEVVPPATSEPNGPVNCYLYTQQITPYFYRYIVDLQQTKRIDTVKFYVPKITTAAFRPKLSLNIWKVTDNEETLIFSRYFHEDLLVQLGINGFKDAQIYRGQRLNCLTVPDVQTQARFLKIQYSFILATTQPHNKYKDYSDKFLLIPLIEGRKTDRKQQVENVLQSLKNYPQDTKHFHNFEKLPPCRYSSDGNKSTYSVHQFPVIELSAVKKEYRQIIDKITANIMDQNMVREAVKGLKISNYEFNRKGIDFAYTYIIHLMNLSKRFPNQMHVSVELMLELFEVLVVFESGPIMRRTFAFLEDNYKRLSHPQRVAFVDALMTKYLQSVQSLPNLRIVERYSPHKILEKLQSFELPIANIFVRLQKTTQKSFKILILKLVSSYLTTNPIANLELYSSQTGKYIKNVNLLDILLTTFSTSLWVLTNVSTVKQQILSQALDLLLLLMSGELGADWKQPQTVALKQFIASINVQDIWRLVFLTLKLKSENLKNKINKLFAVLTNNLTQKFKRSINDMLQQIIVRKEGSLYVNINPALTDELWMNHLQTTLELVSVTKDSLFLDLDIALKLLELPLTPRLWSLALHIIPRNDQVLNAIIKNFPTQFYSSLGKQITAFCEPLAGIRSPESIHINWLQLVRQIRLQGKNLVQLLAGQLEKSSFGGREGLTMATTNQLKNLQIACQLAKLVTEGKTVREHFNQTIIRRLVLWYFLNKSKEKGVSPATQKILILSQAVRQLLGKLAQFQQTTKLALKILLEIRREGELVERNFFQKRIPVHSALTLNKRFCECFEELLNLFMTTDQLCGYFAFELKGLQYILRTIDIQAPNAAVVQESSADQQLLVTQKIINAKVNGEKGGDAKQPQDLKQQEFANNVKIMPNLNLAGLHASNVDWTIYKKGNKTKIVFLSMVEPGYYNQHPLYIQLAKTAQIRSIKIGFPAASYQYNDKLVATPSGIIIEGSLDGVSFEPIGQMDYLRDDAYIMSGVQVWVLNCQRLKGLKSVGDAVQGLGVHRAKYLKIIVKRPIITFIEGQYSQLNGRNYSSLGCSLSFLSVTGDDAQKITSWEGCKEASKKSVLRVLANLLNQSNNRTKRRIANDQHFSAVVKTNFKRIKQYMTKYGEIMPQIIYLVGAGNRDLGDWIVAQFLSEGGAYSEAKIVNQIITSTPDRAFNRLSRFLKSILQKLNTASAETQIESALIYSQEIHFIESFCKTLEESYQLGIENGTLQVSLKNITSIINIYDRRFSSPDVKSAVKLLVNLLYLKKPLQLSENLVLPAMNLVWQNCSDQKPHFYQLMSALLVDRGAQTWLTDSKYAKVAQLIQQTYSSCTHSDMKSLKLQLLLLSQISHHEPTYLREAGVHVELYNRVKVLNYQENDITEAVLKLMRNVVLGNQQEERRMAKLLFDDVGLLVKRKDPFLQKLFVGLLGLQQEVMINLQGLQLQANTKKEVNFKSKYLTYKQSKIINEKINKKYKFNLLGEINGQIKADHQQLFLKAFSCNSFIMVFRFKINDQIHTCGVYSSTPGKRNQEGDYLWEELVYYEKNSFIFFLQEPEPLFINNQGSESVLGNIYGGEQQQENGAMFYDEGSQIFQFTFNTTDPTIPKLSLGKYKQKLPNQLTNSTLDSELSSYSFIGIQFWELKAPNTVHVTDSKISNLLSKSNHAKPPFSYYRHFPIYIFPANITVSKFMGILGIKGSCFHHTTLVSQNKMLADLQKLSTDFVIDLNIQSQETQQQKQEVNELGYIPVMRIFNHFSAMDGVGEVLRLGSQSIKDWKKADRKKNFQHYMQELKSFINLPSFFNLFIKNQQYVTLLFEVASGMPDDESSTRNWEEEYVNNFRFIYKIVSDIFKFDRSASLRDMDRYSDFVQVILEKLSQITKEAPRVLKEQETTEQKNELGLPSLAKAKSEDRKRKKKGTGYGSDNQNSSKWSASQWLQTRKNVSQETLRVISIIASFLDCQVPLKDSRLSDIIKESCLLPLLESAVRSGSLLDISKEPELFKAYLQIVKLISSHPSIIDCVLDLDKKYKPEQSESIYSLLGKLNGTATIFSECLKSGKDQSSNETAEGISIDIQKTYQFVDKSVKNMKKKGKGLTIKQINSMPIAEAYRILLGGLRFGYISIKEGNAFKHAHSSSISTSNPATSKILRLSQELADLSTSLPCQHTNSIFVRCDQSRIDVITIMIMGSKDTPYSNGAFTFDVYCDDSYPNNPPKMLITTTGSGKIRFNPNLYSCGKVCLSLLGTWRGSASQNWDPKVSTLLQLFISTQGITMSDDVYFNQPGFEGEQGTEEGERKNEAYSNIVRLGNVRYAMNGQLKNPPKGFEEVVRRHFYIKQKQILQQCQKWIQWAQKRQASYNGLVNDHNSSWCSELKQSKTKYKELLVKQVEELKQLLSKLPAPDMKQKEQQPAFLQQKSKEKKQVKAVDVKLQEVDVEYDKQPHQIKEYGEQILQDRWSRYIGAMGLEAVKKQAESSVLLIGLKPLGLQIAKNLVLSGLKKLTILQNQTLENTSQHFYMANVKSNSYKDCVFKIKELNPYMLVQHVDTLPEIANYSIIVSTAGYQFSRNLAEKARKLGVKFIYTETKGVSGVYFADLGQHEVNDENGEEPFEGMIKSITNEEEGLVTLLDGLKHPYQDGDYIVLSRVQGMQTITESIEEKSQAQIFFEKQSNQKINGINNRVYKIKVINWNSFRIGDTRNFTPYKNNGLCRNLKVPKKLHFEAMQVCSEKFQNYIDPNMGIYDFEKIGENLSIFLCFKALSVYQATHKSLPANWSIKDNKEFLSSLESLAKTLGKSQQDVQNILNFGKKFGFISEAELPTIGAYLGGLVSQQVVKAITNKYTPIRQFFTFHFNQLMQKVPEAEEEIEKLSIDKEEDFKNIKIVVGRSAASKIQQLKTFVIGAGAIGCQLLKNFAMVNMGSKGEIVVTDPDHIETSNLSRQFLFRDKHVKKAKSATACATLLQLNPKLEGHIHARLDKVCQESEEIYSNQFFKSRNIVANALDNVRARQYMDKRCVQNKVPLFESGTLGPKGHVQVIVPYKTENYGSQNDPNEQAQIPHCTLKMFPEETVHCIEWARDIFGKMFTLNPKALKKVIQAKDIKVLEGQQRETVAKMIKYRPESFQDCIAQAVRKFYIYYRNNVRQLLFTYPIEMKTKEGKPFWTLPKRPPKQINELDTEDEVHRTFISAYSVLLAKIYSLPYPKDFRKKEQKDNIMSIARKVKVQDFVPNAQASKQLEKEVEKESKEANKQQMAQSNGEQKEQTKPETLISEQVQLTQQVLQTKPVAQQFQKDEDSNGHIDLIYSMSNLRCRNYGLNECTWIEAKLKAGKIMAALSTTTSVVAALQTLQIIKLATGGETWRNAFTNLAVPLIQISEPGPAAKHPIGNTTFTVWDEWTVKCSTLRELLNKLKQTYNVEAYNISLKSGKPVYWQAMYAGKEESRQQFLNTKLKTMFEDSVVQLNIAMRKVQGGENYENVPKVKIQIQQ